ncbi:MAG TPA: hypothetical protein VF540_05205, partial [Segetibacter sp.]
MKKYLLIRISNIVSKGLKLPLKSFALAGIFMVLIVSAKAQTTNIFLSGKVVEERSKTPLEG